MANILRILAAALILSGLTAWLATGADRGWTKTSVPRKTLDSVTGIEGITYDNRLVLGLDVVGAAVLVSVVLVGASFLSQNPNTNQ